MTSFLSDITPFMWFLMSKRLTFMYIPEIGEILIGPIEEELFEGPRRVCFIPTENGFEIKDTQKKLSEKISCAKIDKSLKEALA